MFGFQQQQNDKPFQEAEKNKTDETKQASEADSDEMQILECKIVILK